MGLMRALAVTILLTACGTSPAPQSTPQSVTVADAGTTSPVATTSEAPKASSSAPPPEPRRNGPTLKANAAMKMEGTLDDKQIVEAANKNAVGLQQCAVPLVSNDPNVGSLNLQIKVDANGAVSGDLQSPAHDDAKKCILDLVKTWKVTGAGKAMVLLSVVH